MIDPKEYSTTYKLAYPNKEVRDSFYTFLILRMLGIKIDVEVEINRGRLDARVKTDKYIYIMEFKMGTADEAIQQIEEKQYYLPYITDGRKVILLGVAFDKKKKNIKEWLVKEV